MLFVISAAFDNPSQRHVLSVIRFACFLKSSEFKFSRVNSLSFVLWYFLEAVQIALSVNSLL